MEPLAIPEGKGLAALIGLKALIFNTFCGVSKFHTTVHLFIPPPIGKTGLKIPVRNTKLGMLKIHMLYLLATPVGRDYHTTNTDIFLIIPSLIMYMLWAYQ